METREQVQDWINEKAKEYGSKNKFYASQEYKEAYPTIKRIFKTKQIRKAKIVKYDGGEKYAVKVSKNGHLGNGISSIGFCNVALFDKVSEATKYAQKYGYTV